MSGSTIQFESSNIQNILIALVVICALVYGFLEFRKVNTRILELEKVIGNMQLGLQDIFTKKEIVSEPMTKSSEPMTKSSEPMTKSNEPMTKSSEPVINNKIETENNIETNDIIDESTDDIIMNSIINEVEDELSNTTTSPKMDGLFISVETNIEEKSNDERIVEITESDEIDDKLEDNLESSIEENIKEMPNETMDISMDNSLPNYEEYTIRELKDKLTSMNLPTSGNKLKLIERINSNKNKILD